MAAKKEVKPKVVKEVKGEDKVEVKPVKSDSKDAKIKELEARVKELENKGETPIPPKPKRVLDSKGSPIIYENAEVVEITGGSNSSNHKHCSMSDGTTKNVPNELFEL